MVLLEYLTHQPKDNQQSSPKQEDKIINGIGEIETQSWDICGHN